MYGKIGKEVGEILSTVCKITGVELIKGGVCPNHVHLYVSIPPKMSISEVKSKLKGKSALMIFDRHPEYRERMIDTPDIPAEIVDQAAVLYSDSEDEGNGQCLRDLYGVILEVIDEDEIIIQESGKEDSVITVKGNNSKSVIKNARTGDKIKVTYLVKRRADFNPSKIYLISKRKVKSTAF